MAPENSSVATSSPNSLNWWDLHASSLSPSTNNTNNAWSNQTNPNSSCSLEEVISFTNASNHSNLTIESSLLRLVEQPKSSFNDELIGEHASFNQLWSHVLSGIAFNEELDNSQEIGENFLDALSSKSMTSPSVLEPPACHYLKKLDTSWEYNCSTSLNGFEKHLNEFSDEIIDENQRLNKFSNLVSTWSIAPPDPQVNGHFDPQTNNTSSMDHHTQCPSHYIKHPFGDSTPCYVGRSSRTCYGGDDMKFKHEYYYACEHGPDNLFVGKPIMGIHAPIPSLNLSDESRMQRLQTLSPTSTNNRKGAGRASEVRKKRSEESSEATILKKPKQHTSTNSSTKAPKVKLSDRITALQQIVSPFGKTDTASVLFEAIGYIKFLQEQVQLLSNPYLKTNSHKDPWGSFGRKDKGDAKLDLRSRGLCVVPISCTPQVYREINGPDYLTPAYRGCLYR